MSPFSSTWQVAGSSGQGAYSTVFIDVAPTTVSLSVDNPARENEQMVAHIERLA